VTDDNDALVVRLQHLTTRLLRLARAPHGEIGLTSAQYSAMAVLYNQPGVSLVDLARVEAVAHPTMSRLIKGLEKNGMVQRVPDPNDGRSQLLSLSSKGMDLYRQAAARRIALFKTILAQLSPQTIAELTAAVEHVAAPLKDGIHRS